MPGRSGKSLRATTPKQIPPVPATANAVQIRATSQQSRFHLASIEVNSAEIDLETVCVAAGEHEVLVDASLKLKEGIRYGLIGRNGRGKSTLLQALAEGIIPGMPPSLRVQIVTQVDTAVEDQDRNITVLQRVLDGDVERVEAERLHSALTQALNTDNPNETQHIINRLLVEKAGCNLVAKQLRAARLSGARGWDARAEEIEAENGLAEAMARLEVGGSSVDAMRHATDMLQDAEATLDLIGGEEYEQQARKILRGLGFKKAMIEGSYASLSGGWRSRCRLATALLVQTDLLLLDEPTNFMDMEAVMWLEQALPLLTNYTTLIVTSHDQIFLDRIAETTICLRHRQLDYFDGPPGLMMRTEAEEREAAGTKAAALAKKKDHILSSIAAGKKAAKDKGDDNKARMVKSREKKLEERFGLETSAKGTRFKLSRDLGGYHTSKRAGIEIREEEPEVKIKVHEAAVLRSAGALVHLENVTVGYKGKAAVLEGVNLTLLPGGRMALLGSNGQGKSTLARLITSDLLPRKGTVTLHPQMRIGYFDQHVVESLSAHSRQTSLERLMEHCNAAAASAQAVLPGQRLTEAEARRFLGSMGLQGSTAADLPIHALSGGQKVRLALAVLTYRPPHVLVLDEVTTHLDVQTIQALADALKVWNGAIILITHDRWFCNAIIAPQQDTPDDMSIGSTPGQTYLVEDGAVRPLHRGVAEYQELMEGKVRERVGAL